MSVRPNTEWKDASLHHGLVASTPPSPSYVHNVYFLKQTFLLKQTETRISELLATHEVVNESARNEAAEVNKKERMTEFSN